MTSPWRERKLRAGRCSTGKIYEVNLNNPGQTPATFGSGQYTDGIVYDSSGRLFAVGELRHRRVESEDLRRDRKLRAR